jgi:hypothetical protein
LIIEVVVVVATVVVVAAAVVVVGAAVVVVVAGAVVVVAASFDELSLHPASINIAPIRLAAPAVFLTLIFFSLPSLLMHRGRDAPSATKACRLDSSALIASAEQGARTGKRQRAKSALRLPMGNDGVSMRGAWRITIPARFLIGAGVLPGVIYARV